MEKFFSVAVEYQDGTTRTMAARGESHGSVFQQMKQLPGVRRVGKVSEVSPDAFEAVRHGRPIAPQPESRRPGEFGPSHVGLDQLNQPLRGPRVVIDARPLGGEQPFKHLQAPPERPKPPQPVVQQPAPAAVQKPTLPQPSVQTVSAADPAQPTPSAPASDEPAELEYRIVRSRRAGGQPYLLQRGTWAQRDGKRSFRLDWEKGFEDRAAAERHLEWVHQSTEELDAMDDEPTSDDSQLTPQLVEA